LGEDSQILLVKYMICSIVEGKDKFLSPKLNNLQKYFNWKKKIVIISTKIVVGD
jgi:hypothetical protein